MMTDWLTEPDASAHRLPIYAAPFAKAATGGGSDDDDDDDSDDDDDDDDDDEDDIAKLSDEELRAALKETRDKLGKASNQSAKRRKALREKEAELEEARKPKPAPKAPAGKATEDAPDLDAIRAEALREGEKKGIDRAKRSEARAALVAAGVSPDRVSKLVGMVNLDDLDLDDDGLGGIDDAIDELKKEWPELFASKRGRRASVAGEGDRTGDRAPKKELTPSQRQAALITGGARR